VVDILGGREMVILAAEPKKDLAILGVSGLRSTHRIFFLDYPLGESRSLEWGSFVYLMGYPMGFQMITQGIVSNPNMDGKGSFLVDALFNRGFSGGIVLAVRDGVPNFELVGLAKSVSAQNKYVLRPLKDTSEYVYDPSIPYTGDIYVRTESEINYGITHAISIETIREFIQDHQDELIRQGYDLGDFSKK
jgi:S1-C subfamily serine protease